GEVDFRALPTGQPPDVIAREVMADEPRLGNPFARDPLDAEAKLHVGLAGVSRARELGQRGLEGPAHELLGLGRDSLAELDVLEEPGGADLVPALRPPFVLDRTGQGGLLRSGLLLGHRSRGRGPGNAT